MLALVIKSGFEGLGRSIEAKKKKKKKDDATLNCSFSPSLGQQTDFKLFLLFLLPQIQIFFCPGIKLNLLQ